MRCVGPVAWQRNGSFGGTLQAEALPRVLMKMNFEPEFIQYNHRFKWKSVLLNFCFKIIHPQSGITRDSLWRLALSKLRQSHALRSHNEICEYRKNYDAVICRSDQMRNTFKPVIDLHYCLHLTAQNIKKITGRAERIRLDCKEHLFRREDKFGLVSILQQRNRNALLQDRLRALRTLRLEIPEYSLDSV